MRGMIHRRVARDAERGFTLIEIMIALLIGLFLTGAMLTMVQTNRRVFGEQNQLAQMQDNQRIALTMMTDVIQSAGYFPDPHNNYLNSALGAAAPFGVGQYIYGTHPGIAPPGDTIQVRYRTASGDGILNCSGQSNATGADHTYVNTFLVQNGQLMCTVDNVQYPLVGGGGVNGMGVNGNSLDITNMQIQYGVRSNAAAAGNNVDTYMTADLVDAAALWNSVISVRVTLTFNNPLSGSPGQPATFDVQRVIGVMSQTGPTL